MRRISRVVAPAALALALALVGVRWWLTPPAPPAVGHPFPHLALVPLAGMRPLDDAALRTGRPTLVNLFASWCVPCRAEAPALGALGRRGIAVAGIAVRDSAPDAAAFVTASGVRLAAGGVDRDGRVQSALGTTGIPETWLVDGSGIVRARWRGGMRLEDVASVAAAVSSSARAR